MWTRYFVLNEIVIDVGVFTVSELIEEIDK